MVDEEKVPDTDQPIPMILTCPACGARHIDEGDFTVKPHHTHACQSCGMVWRPAIVATVGVQFLPSYKNEGHTEGQAVDTHEHTPDKKELIFRLRDLYWSFGEPRIRRAITGAKAAVDYPIVGTCVCGEAIVCMGGTADWTSNGRVISPNRGDVYRLLFERFKEWKIKQQEVNSTGA